MTLVDMAAAAVRTRSDSTRIFGRFGTIVARIPTTSSALSAGENGFRLSGLTFSGCEDDDASVNDVGRVVNRAVSSRRKRSYQVLLVMVEK